MSDRPSTSGTERRRRNRPADPATVARRLGLFNVVAGLLGLVGPAVENDDDGLINVEPGLFLGLVAVSGRHALLHVLNGTLGLRAGRDPASARRYLKRAGLFWGAFAALGWFAFGFERGVHVFAGVAVDRWGNVGHALLAGICLDALLRSSER